MIEAPLPQLPPGRHGIPVDSVQAHQRRRMLEAVAVVLDETGYAHLTAIRITRAAGVSSSTFYQQFEGLWACVLAAYEAEAAGLGQAVESSCAGSEPADRQDRARAGIGAGLAFLASRPAVAHLLSAEPPPQIPALAAARRDLVERLAAMLRAVRPLDGAALPPDLERRLIGAALALVRARSGAADPRALLHLEPELGGLMLISP